MDFPLYFQNQILGRNHENFHTKHSKIQTESMMIGLFVRIFFIEHLVFFKGSMTKCSQCFSSFIAFKNSGLRSSNLKTFKNDKKRKCLFIFFMSYIEKSYSTLSCVLFILNLQESVKIRVQVRAIVAILFTIFQN